MEFFVALGQARQHFDAVFHIGSADQNRLEAPLQGRILFNMLAIFIAGGSTDNLQFPTS